MKHLILILGIFFVGGLHAQTIERGVNFFRRYSGHVPVRIVLAEVRDFGKEGALSNSDRPGYSMAMAPGKIANHLFLNISGIGNSGLNFIGSIHFTMRDGFSEVYTGELNLEACAKENGQNIFGQFKSLEEVLRYSSEASEAPQFSSCLLSASVMTSDYKTPVGSQPRATLENVKIYLFYDRVEISADIFGHPKDGGIERRAPFKWRSPYMYYPSSQTQSPHLTRTRQETLSILQKALEILKGESGDRQLPKTVAFLMERKEDLKLALNQIRGSESISSQDLIEFSVSVKNAFHILDQAVGLASDRKIQMQQLIQVNSKP